jgi:hypothetical protein
MQVKWLSPFDGFDYSLRALDLTTSKAKVHRTAPELVLLNVQTPLPSDISRFHGFCYHQSPPPRPRACVSR